MNAKVAKMTSSLARQRGAATLFIAMILLVAVTLSVTFTAQTTVTEIRMSANEVRAKQAFAQAQGALDYGLTKLLEDDVVAGTFSPSALSRVTYCDTASPGLPARSAIPATPGNLTCTAATVGETSATIFACGWSDDNAALKCMVMLGGTADVINATPSNPLIARGGINVSGSATVTNYFNNLTIWTGMDLSNIGNSGKTFVRDPTIPKPASNAAIPAPPSNCTSTASYVCTTDKDKTGPDVIANDTSLSMMTSDEFFAGFFGTERDFYQSSLVTMPVAAADANDGTLDGVTNEVIWVEGNVSFTGNKTIGTRDDPVILIINGDMSSAGNVTVYGLVYIAGDFSGTGSLETYGSAVVEDSVGGTGSLDVIYDPWALQGVGGLGPTATFPGTWRDWL